MGKLRAAHLATSKRLQSVFWLLADGKEHSTREIIHTCDRCAISSIASELRDEDVGNNLTVLPATFHDGAYWYRMELDAKFEEWKKKLIEQGQGEAA